MAFGVQRSAFKVQYSKIRNEEAKRDALLTSDQRGTPKPRTRNPERYTSDSYIFFVSAAMFAQLNFSTARFRPASPNFLRSGSSAISRLIFSAMSRENLSGLTGSKGVVCICS